MRTFGSFGVVRSVFGVDSMIRSAVLSFDVNTCFREVSRIVSFNKVLCFGWFTGMCAFSSFGVLRSVFEVDSMIRSEFWGFDANMRLRKVLYENWFESTSNRLRGPLGMIWNHFWWKMTKLPIIAHLCQNGAHDSRCLRHAPGMLKTCLHAFSHVSANLTLTPWPWPSRSRSRSRSHLRPFKQKKDHPPSPYRYGDISI